MTIKMLEKPVKIGDQQVWVDQNQPFTPHNQYHPFGNANLKPGMWFKYKVKGKNEYRYKIIIIGDGKQLTSIDSGIPGELTAADGSSLQIENLDPYGGEKGWSASQFGKTMKAVKLVPTTEQIQEQHYKERNLYKILKVNTTPTVKTLRWPENIDMGEGTDTDYVLFQFGKFKPPFGDEGHPNNVNAKAQYDASAVLDFESVGSPGIILPIPQDLGNESSSNWQGKTFTGIGRAAIAQLGGGNASFAASKLKDAVGNVKAITAALTAAGLNVLPGVGGNLSMNDITGSTQGIVLNPNAELLYDSPELREIGFTYKLFARNQNEANVIRKIVEHFRYHSLPSWGMSNKGAYDGGPQFKWEANTEGKNEKENYEERSGDTFIHVPNLCHFLFMKGKDIHPKLIQFKPCALANVSVNYTPDGTYATYGEGDPVAIELGLKFQETKVVFRSDVSKGF